MPRSSSHALIWPPRTAAEFAFRASVTRDVKSLSQWLISSSGDDGFPRRSGNALNAAVLELSNGVSCTQRKPCSSQGYLVPPPCCSIKKTRRLPESIIWPSVGHGSPQVGV